MPESEQDEQKRLGRIAAEASITFVGGLLWIMKSAGVGLAEAVKIAMENAREQKGHEHLDLIEEARKYLEKNGH